jgi:hypothetical protein
VRSLSRRWLAAQSSRPPPSTLLPAASLSPLRAMGATCRAPGLTVLKIRAQQSLMISTAWCGSVDGRGSAIVTTTDDGSNPIVWIAGAEGANPTAWLSGRYRPIGLHGRRSEGCHAGSSPLCHDPGCRRLPLPCRWWSDLRSHVVGDTIGQPAFTLSNISVISGRRHFRVPACFRCSSRRTDEPNRN